MSGRLFVLAGQTPCHVREGHPFIADRSAVPDLVRRCGVGSLSTMSDHRQPNGPQGFDHVGMNEMTAFLAVLARRPPGQPTACRGWRVRDLVAHLAAGAREEADLIEAALRREPSRPTRAFAEREAAYRAMAYPRLLVALARQGRRLDAAIDALVRDGGRVEFTGVPMTGRD